MTPHLCLVPNAEAVLCFAARPASAARPGPILPQKLRFRLSSTVLVRRKRRGRGRSSLSHKPNAARINPRKYILLFPGETCYCCLSDLAGRARWNSNDKMKASLAVIAALFVSPACAFENPTFQYPGWLTDKATSWSDVQLTNSPCIPVNFGPIHGTGAPAQNQSLFTAPQLWSNVVPPSAGAQTALDASHSLALQYLASPSSSSSTQTEFALLGPSSVVGNVQGSRCAAPVLVKIPAAGGGGSGSSSGGAGGGGSGSSSGGAGGGSGSSSGGAGGGSGSSSGGAGGGSGSSSGGAGGGGSGSSSGGALAPNGAGHSGGGLAAIFSSSTSVSTAARGGTVRGAPGPVAGTGLPLLFLFGGIAFLVVRTSRRNEAVTECPKGAETAE